MKYLREIAQIVTRYREKNLEQIDFNPADDDPDNISKLYFAIKDGKVTTDTQASEYIYGTSIIDTKYTTLKNRLRKRLINLLFFLDIREKDFSEVLVARYQNSKALFWVNTLSVFGARSSATKLAESVLKQAQKYDITSNALQCALVLRNYSRASGSERQYNKYDDEIKRLLRTYERELTAQEYYERLTIRFFKSVAEQPDLEEVCNTYLAELETYRGDENSFTFNIYYYRLKTSTLQISQKYADAVKTCDEALQYFDQNKHLTFKILYGEFYLQQLNCFLYLLDYEQGKKSAELCTPLFPEGGANWFVMMEYRFLLGMHTYHFEEAEAIYNTVTNSTRYQFQPEQTKEKWQLFGLYMDFALRHSENSTIPKIIRGNVQPENFLRTVPNFKKDKRGYNIAILILHIIILLEQNNFNDIISRMDALRTYRNRYLQVSTNRRSALFFRMLQIMEARSFDPKQTQAKSKKYFERLTTRTADAVEAQESLQILPFEWLWQTIIKMLEEKQKAGKL